ncbi:Mov34/MPN/PAD-1 family protein [Polaromonas sp. LjRoot131]|uniref:Mov34/MPN/PAD-1 family protein n=1 Tax=Polaromonas sp. LjRoot131 TaxID=3342262 RepID=UPI003ECE400D
MLKLILPLNIQKELRQALQAAGRVETGGILLGEHVGVDEFKVVEITVHRKGTFATFVRHIEEALGRITKFFERKQQNYKKFNYLGEWHSHPSFEPIPSRKDDASMLEIVQDQRVGAHFVTLLIVKISGESMVGTAHTYLPDGSKWQSNLVWLEGNSSRL